ncbi:MAG TPA: GNAT family N-acetyltransferase [Gallionella sp.]|nr:GNAT family N-acetyltransferase [Gallionella sp.]
MNKIHSATLADIPQLCTLLAILFTQEADFEPDAAKQSAAMCQIIAHPETGHILVLRESTDIIGMVNLLFTVSTACGGKVALLEDMIIHPAHRHDGLGSKLLRAAIELARSENCLRLTLLTDRANDAAIRFYQRHGFGISTMLPLRLTLPE